MKQYATINNVHFEIVKKATKKAESLVKGSRTDYGTIYQAYGKPSFYKVRAWHDWKEFEIDTNSNNTKYCIDNMHICSKNDSFFSIAFDVYDFDDFDEHKVKYIGYITASHNYLVEC